MSSDLPTLSLARNNLATRRYVLSDRVNCHLMELSEVAHISITSSPRHTSSKEARSSVKAIVKRQLRDDTSYCTCGVLILLYLFY